MATQMIRADGVDWPIDSFIDNYRMLRVDGAYPDFDGRDPLCDVLTNDGEYRTRQRASQVNWGGVNAFASEDLPAGGKCDFCGRDDVPGELLRNSGLCDFCAHDENEEWFR